MTLLSDSWRRAWHALAASPPSPALYAQLIAHYAQPQRKYHSLQHLAECIAQLEPALGLCTHPGEVEIALWFHDAIYDLERTDNELQSALWAAQVLEDSGLSAEVCERVKNLVLATGHSALPATADERLLVDVDLAILGAEPARFDDYERQIRQEYGAVAFDVFCAKRRAILAQFLARPQLYSTAFFRSALEARARENIARSLSSCC